MDWNTIAVGVGVLLLIVAWYGLQVVALRDLRARSRVRGDNKLLWAFAILCVPFLGALGYLSMGPTSFLPRPVRAAPGSRIAVAPHSLRTIGSPRDRTVPDLPTLTAPVVSSGSPQMARRRNAAAAATGRPYRRLAIDPVIGTDSADLLPARVSVARSRQSGPNAIRWPGSAIPHGYHQIDADLHD